MKGDPVLDEDEAKAEASRMALRSSAFEHDAGIPRRHTCDGDDVSPQLEWEGAPEGTQSFALVVDDPDAPAKAFVHWVAYDIPAEAAALPEGVGEADGAPGGGTHGVNDFEDRGWGGPCPPRDHGTHHYVFTLYALDRKLGLEAGATKGQLVEAMRGHVLAEAELVGTYEREG